MQPMLIDTPQGAIFAMQAGTADGPTIIALHGYSPRNGWHTWEPLMRPLAEAGWRVVSVDMPGWGQSPAWEPFSPTAAVLAIQDSLGVRQSVLMGKSWGGGVALTAALRHPERVSQLILTAPAFRGALSDLARLTQPVLLAWAKDDDTIPFTYAADLVDAIPKVQLIAYETGGHSAAPNNAADFAPRAIHWLEMNSRQ